MDRQNKLKQKQSFLKVKRGFDLCLAIPLLVCSSPFFFLVAVCIGAESKGPIIYSQKRVGLNGKEFTLYKFRSMYQNTKNQESIWAKVDASQITKCGKLLRKLHLDEWPQLWNIIKNDMSFVGPRPERVEFVPLLEKNIPNYSLRHSVKPGLTGLAQVSLPYAASAKDAQEKLGFDLEYIEHMSLGLELKILFKTIGVLLNPHS